VLLLTGAVVVLSGCAILLSALGLGEPRFTLDSADVVGLPVITDQELAQMLAARSYMPAPADIRLKAMTASAALNDPSVFGVAVRAGVPLAAGSQLFVVAHAIDAGSSPGELRAQDVFVVALSGIEVPPLGRVVLAATREDGSPVSLRHALAALECSVLPGPQGSAALGAGAGADAGLPSAVRINAESASLPRNGAGESVAVHIFPPGRLGLPSNRFVCARAKDGSSVRTPLPAAGAARWPVGSGAVLMSEEQFQTWSALARRSPFAPAAAPDLLEAAALVTAANHFAVRGIEGQRGHWWQQDPQRSPKLIVVARDLQLEGGRARATNFFVVPRWWDGPPPVSLPGVATDLFLDFGADMPRFDLSRASCSPLMLPSTDLECRGGACDGLPGWRPSALDLGGDRLLRGLPRSTLHWRSVSPLRAALDLPAKPNFDIHVAACSMTWAPPRRFGPGCGFNEWTGMPYVEQCNGLDDNCDGRIDEGDICSLPQPQTCPPTPITCGARTCGTVPDGCGNVLVCGAPCP
jgi:hypothetical protein